MYPGITQAPYALTTTDTDREEREEAKKFKARFGFKVSTVALASYELYLRELDLSNSLGVIVKDMTETTNGLIDNIESTVKNTKLVNADVYPLPNGSVNTFEVNYLESGSFDVASVALNGVVQKEGIHYGTDGKTINFLGIPALGTTITVVLHVETSIDLSEVRSEVLEKLPSKLMAGESYCINNRIKSDRLNLLLTELEDNKVETTKLQEDSTKSIVDLQELEVELKDKVSQLDKDIAEKKKKKAEVESSLNESKTEQEDARTDVAKFSRDFAESESRIVEVNTSIDQASMAIEMDTILLAVEEGKAYPDSEKVAELKAKIQQAKTDVLTYKTELSELEDNLKSDKESLNSSEGSLRDATSDVEEYTKSIEKTTTVLFNSNRDRNEFVGHSKVYDMYVKSAEDKVAVCEATIKSFEDDIAKAKEEVKSLEEDPKCNGGGARKSKAA